MTEVKQDHEVCFVDACFFLLLIFSDVTHHLRGLPLQSLNTSLPFPLIPNPSSLMILIIFYRKLQKLYCNKNRADSCFLLNASCVLYVPLHLRVVFGEEKKEREALSFDWRKEGKLLSLALTTSFSSETRRKMPTQAIVMLSLHSFSPAWFQPCFTPGFFLITIWIMV